jgi:nucleotide-binding universal stress UspA family protein
MRHHILLPSDFSDNAWSAALYAIKLHANEQCTFYFSHAWTFLNSGSRTHISTSYLEPLKEKSKAQLEELKNKAQLESVNSDHEFKTIFSLGSLMESIHFAIKDHNIDLVVMGTKGATGAKKFLLGSNSVTVINKVRLCPLMLVPNNCEFVVPEQIVFPTDFSRFYGEELLPIKQLAGLHDSTINILHVNGKNNLSDTQNANLGMLKDYLEDYKHSFNWMPNYETKAHAIKDFIETNKSNILTMINYEHSFIENVTK